MFMGEYHHTIDDKGRITIPSKLRYELGEQFVVTKGLDGCLFIYPKDEWDNITKKYKELPPLDKEIESKKISKVEKDDSLNRGTTNATQGIHSVKKVNKTKTVNHVKSVKRILKRK